MDKQEQAAPSLPLQKETSADPGIEALERALQISFRLLQVVILGLLMLFLLSGLFITEQGQQAIILHMGKVVQDTSEGGEALGRSGLHWAWPEPIDRVVFIPLREQTLRVDDFWYEEQGSERRKKAMQRRAAKAGHSHGHAPRTSSDTLIPGIDGYCITGDRSVLHQSWRLRYKIVHPASYFRAVGEQPPAPILESLLSRAIVRTTAEMTAEQVLLTDVEGMRDQVRQRLSAFLRELGMGIEISRVDLLKNTWPRQVAKAYEASIKATNLKQLSINRAISSADEAIQNAQAKAARINSDAVTSKARQVSKIQSDATAMDLIFPPDAAVPDAGLLRKIYLENVASALSGAKEIFFLHPEREGSERRIRIEMENLSKYKLKNNGSAAK